jgi:cell division protein FtsW
MTILNSGADTSKTASPDWKNKMADKKRIVVKRTAGRQVDFIIVLMTVILIVFGIMMVTSSSYYSSINEDGTPYRYLIRELIWVGSGSVLMWLGATIDYHVYQKFGWALLAVSVILLVLVLTPLGIERNNAQRWIGVGDMTIMPGEVAKICAILFVAWFLSKKEDAILSFTGGILPLLAVMGVFAGLIMKQPNMSTAIIVCLIILGMMFVAGLKWRYLISLGALGIAGGAFMILTDETGYRMKRVLSFMDPFADPLDTGYQVVQSLMALGSGGLFGLGLGQSIQKNLYLPEPQNDFILAIIGEELGFVGILVLMICFLILIYRGIMTAVNAPDRFGMLVASGITIMLGVQVLLNVAVVSSSMPPTGVTLPFISYGGNAMWLFMGSMGILLNISKSASEVDKQ